jgi:hypothetical protein
LPAYHARVQPPLVGMTRTRDGLTDRRVAAGFEHPDFRSVVDVTHWNGVALLLRQINGTAEV